MKWKLETRNIKNLKENKTNPRYISKHMAENLSQSISKFGLCEPIVINPNGFIIGGHQRFKTLKKLGYKEVTVYVPDRELTEKEADELSIRLNKNTGDWDFEILANEWEMNDLLKWGFEQKDLDLVEDEPKDPIEKEKCITCGQTIKKKRKR